MFAVIDVTSVMAVLFLVFLEGILSLDNALVLALMVRHLPAHQQRKALTYGIWGAFAFRFAALFFLTQLMTLSWVKLVGGAYLIYVAMKGIISGEDEEQGSGSCLSFWRTVVLVEMMDIAFSVDSILAAVSLSQSYWIVMMGGLLGIVMMRFAAQLFIVLIRRFPRMASTAYYLVLLIGLKLLCQYFFPSVDFHASSSPYSWIFWFSMCGAIMNGLRGARIRSHA